MLGMIEPWRNNFDVEHVAHLQMLNIWTHTIIEMFQMF